jgi:hypothetical protein
MGGVYEESMFPDHLAGWFLVLATCRCRNGRTIVVATVGPEGFLNFLSDLIGKPIADE